jgi:predicted  nucleic acid-binding Zn-ribbon protein
MFAGAAVALLGLFLIASERELKVKRREIETLLAKLENSPGAPTESLQADTGQAEVADLRTKNRELQNDLAALSKELELSRNRIASLQASRPGTADDAMESQRLSAANDRLTREVSELRSRLTASEAQFQNSASISQDTQQSHARMQAEIADLRQTLDESHAKIRELENARQNLPDLNAIETDHRLERQTLNERISELQKRLATEQENHSELQTLRDRLTEADGLYNSLRAEIRRHEEEIPRWQARIVAAEEDRRRLAALQVPCNELLSKQAELADRQRQLQEELVSFARLIATPADSAQHADAAEHRESTSAPNLEAQTSQDTVHEPAGAPTTTEPKTRRFGILGVLLLVAATGVFHS